MIIPIETTNVVTLPTKDAVPRNGELFLVAPPFGKCQHYNASFEVDVKAGKCKCRACDDEVSPMFVLERLMNEESRWNQTRSAYMDEMKRLGERSKTKCRNCGVMTRISK